MSYQIGLLVGGGEGVMALLVVVAQRRGRGKARGVNRERIEKKNEKDKYVILLNLIY